MKRSVVVTVGLTALVAAISLTWVDVRRERAFRQLIAAGDQALTRGETFDAIEAFSGAIAFRGDSMVAHLKRGDTYRRRGDFAAALRDLGQATTLDPGAPRPLELLGDVNASLGRHDRAVQFYERYLTLDDRAPGVLYKLGLSYYRDGQPEKAEDPLLKATALDGKLVEAHYALALSLRGQKRHDQALRALTAALDVDATFTPAREELADLLSDLGRQNDGIQQLEALAVLEPAKAERRASVGLAYVRLGQLENATQTLARAAEVFPDSAFVRTALGFAWLEMAQSGTGVDTVALRKATAALRTIADQPDASSETLAQYGRALLLAGNAAAAERVLQQAVTRIPVAPAAFRYLADAAQRLGHDFIARDAEERFARF